MNIGKKPEEGIDFYIDHQNGRKVWINKNMIPKSEMKVFKCGYLTCTRIFKTKAELMDHLREEHWKKQTA